MPWVGDAPVPDYCGYSWSDLVPNFTVVWHNGGGPFDRGGRRDRRGRGGSLRLGSPGSLGLATEAYSPLSAATVLTVLCRCANRTGTGLARVTSPADFARSLSQKNGGRANLRAWVQSCHKATVSGPRNFAGPRGSELS